MSFDEWLLKEHGKLWVELQADLLQQGFALYHVEYEKTKLLDEYHEFCIEQNIKF